MSERSISKRAPRTSLMADPPVSVQTLVSTPRFLYRKTVKHLGDTISSRQTRLSPAHFASSIGPRTERCNSEDSDNSTRQARCTCHFRWQDVHLRPHDTFEQSCRLVQHIPIWERTLSETKRRQMTRRPTGTRGLRQTQ